MQGCGYVVRRRKGISSMVSFTPITHMVVTPSWVYGIVERTVMGDCHIRWVTVGVSVVHHRWP